MPNRASSGLGPGHTRMTILVVISMVVALLGTVGPASSQEDSTADGAVDAEAAESGDNPEVEQDQTVDETKTKIDAVEAELAEAEAEAAAIDREMATLGAKVRAQDLIMANNEAERERFEAQAEEARADLEEPQKVRREIATNAYVRGDPRLQAAYSDLLSESNLAQSGSVRNLLNAVDVWASEEIVATERTLAVATVEAEARVARFNEADTTRTGFGDELAERLVARGEVMERIEALRTELAELRVELREARAAALAALSGESETDEPGVPPKIRPALAVKIDNAPRARPQSGLPSADIVFEEIVEGRLTRFVAVFQSRDADPVGPIRSARTSDVNILGNLNSPLFANSGGNPGTLAIVRDSPLVDVGATNNGGAFRRNGSRAAPHNLYSSTNALYAADGGRAGLPPQVFSFRSRNAPLPASAQPATTLRVAYGLTTATHTWDEELGGWRRATDGAAHNDASGAALAPENVIVQFIEYGSSPADSRSPEAIMVGEGEAWILTDGHIIRGRWARPSAGELTTYTTADGAEIPLTPGQTWVLLPKAGQASVS